MFSTVPGVLSKYRPYSSGRIKHFEKKNLKRRLNIFRQLQTATENQLHLDWYWRKAQLPLRGRGPACIPGSRCTDPPRSNHTANSQKLSLKQCNSLQSNPKHPDYYRNQILL